MRKKILLTAALGAACILSADAQSAINAYQLSQQDMRGTARFMSMAGAFGALGGDLSTLGQNPAGIGLYRKSEVGVTVDFDFESSNVGGVTDNRTHVYCPNFGYVGAVRLDNSVMPYFQWGVSYGRAVSFDRTYQGSFGDMGTSLSNYLANFATGEQYRPSELGQSDWYNPYLDSNAYWLPILAYNSYMINPPSENSTDYSGLFDEENSVGNSMWNVRTRGYVDEYNINFGGNFSDIVYWGLGFGITDVSYTEETNYDEEIQNALIARSTGTPTGVTQGDAYFNLNNLRHVSGTGFNFKIGAIVKPINEWRIGIAIHTPTYYNLTDSYDALVDYSYAGYGKNGIVNEGTAYSDYAFFDWKLRTPWRLIASTAAVVGGRFILSADYEYDAYKDMWVGDANDFANVYVNDDIKYYYRGVSNVRIGAEYRITPQFSARAGFGYVSSALNKGVNEGDEIVYTSGTNPAYTFDTSTRYLTLGLGYRVSGFYIDAAYVNKYRKSTYHPFTSYEDNLGWVYNPYADFTTADNNLVLSLGFKF